MTQTGHHGGTILRNFLEFIRTAFQNASFNNGKSITVVLGQQTLHFGLVSANDLDRRILGVIQEKLDHIFSSGPRCAHDQCRTISRRKSHDDLDLLDVYGWWW
jgi:hypothetical protein